MTNTRVLRRSAVLAAACFFIVAAGGAPASAKAFGEDVFGPSGAYDVVTVGSTLAPTSGVAQIPLTFFRGANAEAPTVITGILRYRSDVLSPAANPVVQSTLLQEWYGKQLTVDFLPPDSDGWGSVVFEVSDAVAGKGEIVANTPLTTFDDQRQGGDPEEQTNPFPLGSIRFAVTAETGVRTPLLFTEVSMEAQEGPVRNVAWIDGYFTVGNDQDQDGIVGFWETQYGLDPADPADADDDLDGDGLTNVQEFLLNGDPTVPGDVPDTFYVAADGSDEGDGSQTDPWATLAHAMNQAAGFAAPFHPVTISVGPGTYNERLLFERNITVQGAGREVTTVAGSEAASPTEPVVEAEANSGLSDLTVTFGNDPGTEPTLLRINEVPFQVRNVIFEGGLAEGSRGIYAFGQSSSGSFVEDSVIRRLDFGLYATNSGITVTRSLFEDIGSVAVFAEPAFTKLETGEIAPMLGQFPDTERTGLNRFRNIGQDFVVNETSAPLPCEMNDWGIYLLEEIDQRIEGPSDPVPFVQKSLGPSSVVVTVRNAATDEVLPASTVADVDIPLLSLQAEQDNQTGLYLFDAVPSGTHTVEGEAEGIGTGSVQADVDGLSIESVTLSLVAEPDNDTGGCRRRSSGEKGVLLGNLFMEGAVLMALAAAQIAYRRRR